MDSNQNPPPFSPPPPPASPPPLIVPPARQTPPPRRGRGWMVFALILMALLLVSVFANFTQLFSGVMALPMAPARSAAPRLEEFSYEHNDADHKIALIDVDGIITSRVTDAGGHTMAEIIKAQLKRAGKDARVRAVILRVDSPGGEVLASEEINRAIAEFQSDSGKPVIASMGSLAASGGYYVAAPCRWIVASELTITGSIGVIMSSWNYRGLMDKVGLRPDVYKSGKFKDMLSGSRKPEDIPPEERGMLEALINEVYTKFQSRVEEGRTQAQEQNRKESDPNRKGRALSSDWKDYADGRVLSGSEALKHGFVDELGDFQDAVERAQQIAGISNANLVIYQPLRDLSDLFRLFGQAQSRAVTLDLGMELPKLEAGRLYFLSPTVLH